MMQKIILITLLLLIIPAATADQEEMKIVITECDRSPTLDEPMYIHGQLMYADGSELKVPQGGKFAVYLLLNGEYHRAGFGTPYATYCDSDGSFIASCNREEFSGHQLKPGDNTIQVVFEGKDTAYGKTVHYSHMPCKTDVVSVSAYYVAKPYIKPEISGLVKFIGYAKGIFALVFFGVLSITMGTGCYSAAVHDPQKKAGAQDGLFSLLKILGTVTCFYMAVLFLASA